MYIYGKKFKGVMEMIWLIFIIPVVIVLVIAFYIDKKNKGVNNPPDVNKRSQNVETDAHRHQFYNNHHGGGNDGGNL